MRRLLIVLAALLLWSAPVFAGLNEPGTRPRPGNVTQPRWSQTIYSSGSTLSIGAGLDYQIKVILSASVTITMQPGLYDGQPLRLFLVQDSTGSRTVAFDSTVEFGADITSFTASTAASKVDVVGLIWSTTKGVWLFVAYARGF